MFSRLTSDMESSPRKTMRRGTHSCVECRQRKVRCVSVPNARKCKGCSVKELPCINQDLHNSRLLDSDGGQSILDRLQKLESMLDQVVRNQSRISEEFGSGKPERSERKNLRLSRRNGVAERRVSATEVEGNVWRKQRKVDVVPSNTPNGIFPKARDTGDEPFLRLFEGHDDHKTRDRNLQGHYRDGPAGCTNPEKPVHYILEGIRLQIPNSGDLMSILQAGHFTMNLWTGAFPDALGTSESASPEKLRAHIYSCLYSDDMAEVAKLMLCLTLQLQQLPNDLDYTCMNLPAPLEDLQEYYLSSAEGLLSDERLEGTLKGLECMLLQSEYYINVGSLYKVWLIVRRAISLAQLLGLHRKIDVDVESSLAIRRNAIWTDLWQRERALSLLLGLPCSTLNSQMPTLTPNNDPSDLQGVKRLLRDLGTVTGHIIDRDQEISGKAYSETLKISERLEECQNIMPPQWWDFTPDSATPTDVIRGLCVAKMRFYTVQRLLHLPFLLKSSNDRKFESSRLSTLHSSREIIKVYSVLRDEQRPVFKLCDMVDFQVFAAAMTLVIDLLACSGSPDHGDLHREERDWQLVHRTAEILGRFSQSRRGCQVAAMGARVLEDFSHLRNESAEGVSKVDIPYFGRVEIVRRRDARLDEHISHTQPSSQTNHQAQSQPESGIAFEGPIESMVMPDSYLFPLPAASQLWPVADENWTHMLDLNMADDWSWFPGDGVN